MDAPQTIRGFSTVQPWLARLGVERQMVLAAFVLSVVCFATGERVPVNGGMGWDGLAYARWAQDFHNEVFVKGVDSYHINRILPSAVVHYSLRALSISPTDRSVLRAFATLDILLIALVAWLWGHIAQQMEISHRGKWLGFVGFFVNYIVLKHTVYCPVTTDVWAFAIGTAMLWCYLGGRTKTLYAIVVVGAFAWPMAIYIGALLLIFPRDLGTDDGSVPVRFRWNLVVASAVTAIALVGIKVVLRKPPDAAVTLVDPIYLTPVHAVVNLSVVVSLLYLYFGLCYLLDSDRLFAVRRYLTWRRAGTALSVALLLVAIRQVQSSWAGAHSNLGLRQLLPQTAYATAAKPGVFLVAHVAYFGPMFLLALFLWRPICRLLNQYGAGLVLAVCAGFVLSLNSQSRFVLNVWVMLVPFIVKATDELDWGPRQYSLIVVLSLLTSKVWLTTNHGPYVGNQFEFPDQYLFMSHGPWISHTMYIVQGTIFVAAAGLMWAVCFRPAARQLQAPGLLARQAA